MRGAAVPCTEKILQKKAKIKDKFKKKAFEIYEAHGSHGNPALLPESTRNCQNKRHD
jgi:hypothetical protein